MPSVNHTRIPQHLWYTRTRPLLLKEGGRSVRPITDEPHRSLTVIVNDRPPSYATIGGWKYDPTPAADDDLKAISGEQEELTPHEHVRVIPVQDTRQLGSRALYARTDA